MRKTAEERAAYQRDYRARKLAKHNASQGVPILGGMATSLGVPVEAMPVILAKDRRIAELETEVADLKKQLAARAPVQQGQFNSRPFTPVPKK